MQPTDDNAPTRNTHAAQATHEAARWLAALSDEQCTVAEREQFFEWLRSSTQHVNEFLRISTIARRAMQRSLWPEDSMDALVAAALAERNVEPLQGGGAAPGSSGKRGVVWAIAASFAVAAAAAALMFAQPRLWNLFDETYATGVGEQRSITLEDGSIVQLNSQSRLLADFSASMRAIELEEGEAIFRVAKDESRPFRVRTQITEIVAVGTAFNVNANVDKTIVTVLEGRVHVQQRPASGGLLEGDHQFELTIGEQLIVSPSIAPIQLSLADPAKVTAWTERRLIFEDTPIAAAAREFARYSTRTIRIEDRELSERRITGVFDAADPGSLVQFLETDENVEVRPQGEGWVVSVRE